MTVFHVSSLPTTDNTSELCQEMQRPREYLMPDPHMFSQLVYAKYTFCRWTAITKLNLDYNFQTCFFSATGQCEDLNYSIRTKKGSFSFSYCQLSFRLE